VKLVGGWRAVCDALQEVSVSDISLPDCCTRCHHPRGGSGGILANTLLDFNGKQKQLIALHVVGAYPVDVRK
jgi:hypothetical protein